MKQVKITIPNCKCWECESWIRFIGLNINTQDLSRQIKEVYTKMDGDALKYWDSAFNEFCPACGEKAKVKNEQT